MEKKDIIILGIETSCDETSVAVVKNGREVLSNIINSQIDIHEKYGGVVPEIASRCHTEVINMIYKEALKEANITLDEIDAIACTYGPGLVGALLVGVSYAKALSYASNKKLVGVNHIEGHIAANYITNKELKPPFICLIISGGHTHLVYVEDYTKFKVLGKTRDDAIVANINLPKTHLDNLDFSFSGIKTAILNLYHKNPNVNKADLCMSFEKDCCDILIENVMKAVKMYNVDKIVLAGGVSANSYIRNEFLNLEKEKNIKVYYPELKLCTDNAAMIASAAHYNYICGKSFDIKDKLDLNAIANLKIGE